MKLSQRIELMDIARSLGMVAVIAGHVLILFAVRPFPFDAAAFAATRWLYAFHMPLFFFLSGVMYRPGGIANALAAAITFIFLAQVTHLFGLLLAYLVTNRDISIRAVIEPVILLRSFSLGVTWFLVAIGITRLLFTCVMEGGPRLKGGVALLLAASLGIIVSGDIMVFQIHTLWAGVLFYAIGHLCSKTILIRLDPQGPRVWPRGWIAAGFVLSAAATTLLAPLNLGCSLLPFDTCGSVVVYGHPMVRMITSQYGFLPLFVVTAFCGTACVIFLSALMAALPTGWRKPWTWMGRNTLPLLILNGCFLVTANDFIRRMMEGTSGGPGPWLLCMGVVALHIVVLPVTIPAVSGLERGLRGVAQAAVSRIATGFSISD